MRENVHVHVQGTLTTTLASSRERNAERRP